MVCVECACKLDLLFDFRERSILTAHLFTNMITVNDDNTIEQTISLQEEEQQQQKPVVTESNYNQDNDDDFKIVSSSLFESLWKGKSINDNDDFFFFIQHSPKFKNDLLSSQVCSTECENNVHESNIVLESSTDLVPEMKSNSDLILSDSKMNDDDVGDVDGKNDVVSDPPNVETVKNPPTVSSKKNVRLKTGEKKNESKVCMECGRQYQTNYKLQEHMRKHTGEKPYSCSYQDCKKAFRLVNSIKKKNLTTLCV